MHLKEVYVATKNRMYTGLGENFTHPKFQSFPKRLYMILYYRGLVLCIHVLMMGVKLELFIHKDLDFTLKVTENAL